MTTATGYHEGELAVQQRAGTTAAAARLEGMLEPGPLHRGLIRFLADQTFAALTARDADGRLWISPLSGPAGFLTAGETTLDIAARPGPGDPLHELPAPQAVGLLVVDFATRRRVRVNGTLARAGDGGLRIDVEQAYGNCPQHITRRTLLAAPLPATTTAVRRASTLDAATIAALRAADTLLVGTAHPSRGADASHRGGPPGFVRVEDATHLSWPDYPGNAMFNTLGNLAVDPTAALLVPDFDHGRTAHLSGTATVEWDVASADDLPGERTGRRVRFTVTDVVHGPLLAAHTRRHPTSR